ncbi:MAG: 2-oxoglutarate dehydrogenase E1 component, partial [Gammaproteobacteria bacterium]
RSLFSTLPEASGLPFSSDQSATTVSAQNDRERKQGAVLRLINAYRTRGHSVSQTDPLGIMNPEAPEDFDLAFQGLDESDLDHVYDAGSLAFGDTRMPLRRIRDLCEAVYCGPIGIEYMHITNTAEKRWLQERLETQPVRPAPSADFRKHVLQRLTAAEGLERYLHTRFVGQKRFSLEGGEALIPAMQELIQQCGSVGVKEIVIGMAHRGREHPGQITR